MNSVDRYKFKDTVGYGEIMTYIHPLQQKYVKSILENVPKYVEKIYIFGSSTTLFCNESSDIDLIIIGPEDKKWETIKIIRESSKGVPKDILYHTQEEYDELKKEFDSVYEINENTGVLIYERSDMNEKNFS